jgi:hypothetical protein
MTSFVEIRNNYSSDRNEAMGRKDKENPFLAVYIVNGAVKDVMQFETIRDIEYHFSNLNLTDFKRVNN